jgi:hypothetical protein
MTWLIYLPIPCRGKVYLFLNYLLKHSEYQIIFSRQIVSSVDSCLPLLIKLVFVFFLMFTHSLFVPLFHILIVWY